MERQDFLDGFEFEKHFIADDDVCPVAAIERNTVIQQGRSTCLA